MRIEQHREMDGMMKEFREFSKVSLALADKVQAIKSKIVAWDNERENAELLTKKAQQELEGARAELQIQMNRLPHELAPLRNKIMEQERNAASLLAEAQAARQEAQAAKDKAEALLYQAEVSVGKEPGKRGPGRPKKAE